MMWKIYALPWHDNGKFIVQKERKLAGLSPKTSLQFLSCIGNCCNSPTKQDDSFLF